MFLFLRSLVCVGACQDVGCASGAPSASSQSSDGRIIAVEYPGGVEANGLIIDIWFVIALMAAVQPGIFRGRVH